MTKGVCSRLPGILGNDHGAHKEVQIIEFIHESKDLLVIGNAQIAPSLGVLDVIGVDSDDDFYLVPQFVQELDFIVWFVAWQDSGSVEVFQHLAAKFHIELAIKLADALQNMVPLQVQVLFRIKSNVFHFFHLCLLIITEKKSLVKSFIKLSENSLENHDKNLEISNF